LRVAAPAIQWWAAGEDNMGRGQLSALLVAVLAVGAAVAVVAGQPSCPEAQSLVKVDGGYELQRPRQRVTFGAGGIEVEAGARGPTWTWRLTRVGAADRGDLRAEPGRVEPTRAEDLLVRYDRVAIDEEYVIGPTTIEQRFVLQTPPSLGGNDLVIEGAVESDGKLTIGRERWEWRNRAGLVWLGRATVVDAEGEVLESRFEVTAAATRLEVDGSDLQAAAYPVVVDPEIGANDFRISEMGPDGDPDYGVRYVSVAFNATLNQYLVVWVGDSNEGGLVDEENEVFGQLLDASGSHIHTNDFRISDVGCTGDAVYDAYSPDVSWNSLRNEYLVVWEADDPEDGVVNNEYEIWGQVLAADGSSLNANDFRISHMGPDGNPNYRAIDAAVAYNSTWDEYLVVWAGDTDTGGLVDNEGEIWAQRVSFDGVLIGPSLRMSDMGGTGDPAYFALNPDVAYNSHDDQYLIVWFGDDNVGGLVDDELEIFGQLIDSSGVGVGPNDYRLSDVGGIGDPSFDAFFPTVAYNDRDNEYLVVWYGDDNVGGLVDDEFEVFSQRLTADLSGLGSNDYRLSDMGGIGDPSFRAFLPRIAYSPATSEYAVVWYGDDNVGGTVDGEYEVYCQMLTAGVVGVGPNDARISDIGGLGTTAYGVLDYYSRVVGVAANSNTGQFLAVWIADDPVGALVDDEYEVFGQLLTASALFFDGFESGSTGAWSSTVP
jgi:hypothetical protein